MNNLTQEQFYRLQLAFSENVGAITFRDLIRYYKSAEEALKNLPQMASAVGKKRKIKIASMRSVEEQVKFATQAGITILTSDMPAYPRLLREIEDCPPFLFVKGHTGLLSQPGVSIVGSRNCSLNGLNIARKFGFDLVENNYTVISGMARGIDAGAHEGALASFNAKGGTIAVLGTGVDIIYPVSNQKIYEQIAERGCIISEFPMGTTPMATNFPRRNRIISGLGLGTLVIEASMASGSLITARRAIAQNKEVFAIPGSPLNERSAGPNQLIKDGAHLVTCSEDILDILQNDTTKLLLDSEQPRSKFDEPFNFIHDDDLNKARKIVLSQLSPEVTGVDQLIRSTGLPTEVVNIILVELELSGLIERFAGQKIALIYNNEWNEVFK